MNEEYSYRFGNICERDIDVLLLNSFTMDPAFLDFFCQGMSMLVLMRQKEENEFDRVSAIFG